MCVSGRHFLPVEDGGSLVYKKHAEDGMTIAVAKREWSVRFDEK